VIDAGTKALGREPMNEPTEGFGQLLDRPDVVVSRMSEEHGILDLGESGWRPAVGDVVRVVPNHVCVTVHLQDVMYGVRGERVERSWPIAARGRGQPAA
jgi:D-serine deaminase-like pyridoxal phosphate-dependent protein